MNKFHPQVILCPTDYSDLATQALKDARAVAACFHARVIVLHAEFFEAPAYFTADQEKELLQSLKRSQKAAEAHLRKYAQGQLRDFGDVETTVVDQRAIPAILSTARNQNADLIVMGTHGRSGWNRFMLGSVTERILQETHLPVLAVRFKEGEEKTAPASFKKILCPVNYTEVAHLALEHAVAVAECFQAALHVLHIIEPSSQDESADESQERLCTWIPE